MIIIGTGAGGGTLAHRLAPSGKRILLLERGGYLPREPENWDSRGGLRQGPLPAPSEHWYDKDGAAASSPTSSTSSAATPSSTARSSSGCASATSSEVQPLRRRLARRGRSPTPTSSPTTPRPSGSTSCTARPARTRPSRPRSGPFPYPAVSHEPRIQQLARRLRAHRPPPVPPAGRRRPRRDRSRRRAAACAATASTASRA